MQVVIEVNNSHSKIQGLTSVPFNKLRKELSYSIDAQAAYFSNNHFNKTRYCIDKHGVFPTGLLSRCKAFLLANHIKVKILDKRQVPPKSREVDHKAHFDFKPHAWQLEAMRQATMYERMIISATTGSGKSLVIALIASMLSVRTLIVVPSLQIKEQLIGTFKGIFKDMSNITIENIDSTALETATDYDCLIIDEAHHVAAKTYQKLNKNAWKGIYYRFFMTATPFRNQTEETLLFEGIAGDSLYRLTYKEAVKYNYVVPVEAYYIEMPKVETDAYTYQQVYSELVVNNLARNKKIANLVTDLHAAGMSTLCLVKEIQHGMLLAQMTGAAFANGQDEETRPYIDLFSQGKLKALIGTTGIVSEGVDTKACEYVIITGLGKAKSAFMQQVGRAIRTYPGKETGKVIIIKDRSHKFTLKHFNEQKKILLDEYGVTVVKLEI